MLLTNFKVAAALTGALAAFTSATATAAVKSQQPSVVVGDLRVTALSPQLVRVEPRGPTGSFEDLSLIHI